MGWITWDQTLELGNAMMDAEHRQLVELVNQLAKAIINRVSADAYEALLNDLLRHAQEHFADEERLMTEHRYPFADEHRAEHQRLIKDFKEHRTKFGGNGELSISLLYFFDQWLTRHILGSDRDLAGFLATK